LSVPSRAGTSGVPWCDLRSDNTTLSSSGTSISIHISRCVSEPWHHVCEDNDRSVDCSVPSVAVSHMTRIIGGSSSTPSIFRRSIINRQRRVVQLSIALAVCSFMTGTSSTTVVLSMSNHHIALSTVEIVYSNSGNTAGMCALDPVMRTSVERCEEIIHLQTDRDPDSMTASKTYQRPRTIATSRSTDAELDHHDTAY